MLINIEYAISRISNGMIRKYECMLRRGNCNYCRRKKLESYDKKAKVCEILIMKKNDKIFKVKKIQNRILNQKKIEKEEERFHRY